MEHYGVFPDNSTRTSWVESTGGPLVLIPRADAASWCGTQSDDYVRACCVNDYLGIVVRPEGVAIVLGDEPLRTTRFRHRDGEALLRWRFAPDEAAIWRTVAQTDLSTLEPAESLRISSVGGPYLLFDAAHRMGDCEVLEIELPVGNVDVLTYIVSDGVDVSYVLHLFSSCATIGMNTAGL